MAVFFLYFFCSDLLYVVCVFFVVSSFDEQSKAKQAPFCVHEYSF